MKEILITKKFLIDKIISINLIFYLFYINICIILRGFGVLGFWGFGDYTYLNLSDAAGFLTKPGWSALANQPKSEHCLVRLRLIFYPTGQP